MSATPESPRLPAGLTPLTRDEEAVLRAIGRMMRTLPRGLDADLERDQRMSASEYTALRVLSETDGRMMRMSELAQACDMSLSGMTRLAAKLERVGFLKRTRCEQDARGWNATLTEAGMRRLEEAWPAHLASVRRRIFDHLDGIDLTRLAAALNDVAGEG